jgi:Na+/H+ antiporter NhaA
MVFRVRRTSWHYKLLRFFVCEIPEDFCSYWRKITGVFLMCLIGTGLVSTMLFYLLVVPYILAEHWLDGLIFQVLVAAVVGAVVGLVYLIVLFVSWLDNYEPPQNPGLVRMKYRSWKDKYCPMVEIVNE